MQDKIINWSKNIIINRPAIWMTEQSYVNYIKFISGFRLKSFLILKSKLSTNFSIYRIVYRNHEIYFQSPKRVSRFIKGFHHAGNRMWKRYDIDFLLGDTKPETIIDIGANIGEFSYYSHDKFNGDVKVIAFEPDPVAIECFEKNLTSKDVYLYKIALSNKIGIEVFFLKPESADSSLHKPVGNCIEYSVKASTLDAVLGGEILKKPILLKMDAEGHEPEVLLGASKILSQVNFVAIDAGPERSGRTTANEVSEILIFNGFREIKVTENNLVTAQKV